MLGSIYTGLSGMIAYNQGLDVVSNNVANLNTPGYKSSDLLFRDSLYRHQFADGEGQGSRLIGGGVAADSTSVQYRQGEIRQTGNDTDVAVNGNGFFVIREDDNIYYTRAGQFKFDEDGYLVTNDGKGRVAGIDSRGNLTDINIADMRSDAPSATARVTFHNNLSTGSTQHVINNLEVVDSNGESHLLTATFTNNDATTPRSWLVDVTDEDGNVIFSGGEIRFQGNGSPETGYNTFSFSYVPAAASASQIVFDFGTPGSFSASTSFTEGTTSSLSVDRQDGYGFGSLTQMSFSREGTFTTTYSNGQSRERTQLALAQFNDLDSLQILGEGLFSAAPGQTISYGAATASGLGEIAGGSIELSNVELTRQFTDMIIIQRGYQASSQVLTTANELIQQLLDMGHKG